MTICRITLLPSGSLAWIAGKIKKDSMKADPAQNMPERMCIIRRNNRNSGIGNENLNSKDKRFQIFLI